ncbi:MAG: hypothetical protein GWO02_18330 [Gammaproteobacteria bacterium]|nr:hypothetical protein [Gammaproteobacteria bacterium]
MDAPYELNFRPIDEHERDEFETVLHGFVALEADKPRNEASSVFARYDRPSGCWVLGFDTHAALKAFKDHWRARVARLDRIAGLTHTNGS